MYMCVKMYTLMCFICVTVIHSVISKSMHEIVKLYYCISKSIQSVTLVCVCMRVCVCVCVCVCL